MGPPEPAFGLICVEIGYRHSGGVPGATMPTSLQNSGKHRHLQKKPGNHGRIVRMVRSKTVGSCCDTQREVGSGRANPRKTRTGAGEEVRKGGGCGVSKRELRGQRI